MTVPAEVRGDVPITHPFRLLVVTPNTEAKVAERIARLLHREFPDWRLISPDGTEWEFDTAGGNGFGRVRAVVVTGAGERVETPVDLGEEA